MLPNEGKAEATLKAKMRQPVPLGWALAAMLLFLGFVAVTQYQFNDANSKQVESAKQDQFFAELRTYDLQVKDWEECIRAISSRTSLRDIFEIVSDYPAKQFPGLPVAIEYNRLIDEAVDAGLPVVEVITCPDKPREPKKS